MLTISSPRCSALIAARKLWRLINQTFLLSLPFSRRKWMHFRLGDTEQQSKEGGTAEGPPAARSLTALESFPYINGDAMEGNLGWL